MLEDAYKKWFNELVVGVNSYNRVVISHPAKINPQNFSLSKVSIPNDTSTSYESSKESPYSIAMDIIKSPLEVCRPLLVRAIKDGEYSFISLFLSILLQNLLEKEAEYCDESKINLFLEYADSYPQRSIILLKKSVFYDFLLKKVKKDPEMTSIIICKLIPLLVPSNIFTDDNILIKILSPSSFWGKKAISLIKNFS